MTAGLGSVKKIRKFRVHPRPSAVMRNLRALTDNAQATPELQAAVDDEARRAPPLLEPAALYGTLDRAGAPEWTAPFWAPPEGAPAPVSLTLFAVTIGPGLESELADALTRGEALRSRILTALGEELADQAAVFVERLTAEEARQDSCEIFDRTDLTDPAQSRPLLEVLEAARVGIVFDAGGHRTPRFTRIGVIPWGPPKKRK